MKRFTSLILCLAMIPMNSMVFKPMHIAMHEKACSRCSMRGTTTTIHPNLLLNDIDQLHFENQC